MSHLQGIGQGSVSRQRTQRLKVWLSLLDTREITPGLRGSLAINMDDQGMAAEIERRVYRNVGRIRVAPRGHHSYPQGQTCYSLHNLSLRIDA